MYRIRLPSGDELSYDSNEAFAAAVRSGAVVEAAEIFHSRSERWLPVKLHPHYKAALTAAPRSGAPAAPERADTGAAVVAGRATRRALRLTRPSQVQRRPPQRDGERQSEQRPPHPELDFVQLEPQFEVADSETVQLPPAEAVDPAAEAMPEAPAGSAAEAAAPPAEPVAAKPEPAQAKPDPKPAARTPTRPSRPRAIADEEEEEPSNELRFIEVEPPAKAPPEPPRTRELRFLEVESKPAPRRPAPPETPTIPPPIVAPARREPLMAPRPLDPALFGDAPAARPEPAPTVEPRTAPEPARLYRPERPAEAAPEPAAPAAAVAPEPAAPAAAAVPEPQPVVPVVASPDPPVAQASPEAPTELETEPVGAVALWQEIAPPEPVEAKPGAAASGPLEDTPFTALIAPPAPAPLADYNLGSPFVRRRSRRPMLLAASVAGLIVIGGLVAWQPWRPRSATAEPPQDSARQASLAASAGPAVDGATPPGPASGFLRSRPDGAVQPVPEQAEPVVDAPPVPTASLAIPPASPAGIPAPVIASPAALPISPAELTRRYNGSYADAESDLEARLTRAGFARLLLPARLADQRQVAGASRAIAAAAGAVKAYRQREAAIEQAYQDTLVMVGQKLNLADDELRAWGSRPSKRESAETVQLTDSYLAQLDGLFSLLAAHRGEYRLVGDSIVFDNPAAARAYTGFREWLMSHAGQAADSAATVRQMLRATAAADLPPAGG